MTRHRTTLRATAAALVAGLVLTACTGDPSGAPSSSAPSLPTGSASPMPSVEPVERPEVGDCYAMTFEEALAPTSDAEPVPCTDEHASQTYHVGRLTLVVDGHLLAVDSDRVQRQAGEACPRRLPRWLGGTPAQLRLTMLRPVWFTPTLEESDAGAAWFRCDVVALADDETLLPMKRPARGLLRDAQRRRLFGICGTDKPGAPDFARVACAREHSWRAVASYDVSGEDYPLDRLKAEGAATCKDAVGAQSDDPLDFEWGFDYPSEEQWEAGQRYGLCWAPD